MQKALKILEEKTEVECRGVSQKEYVLSGTFNQIKSAQKLLQDIFHRRASVPRQSEGGNETFHYGDTTQTQQNSSETWDTEAVDNVDSKDPNSFEVQPQFMKLLKRVYKTDLQDIEEKYGVEIVWSENATHVKLHPSKTPNNSDSYQKGCDAFIDLYQIVFPNMGREEVELNNADVRAVEVINSVETENDVVIEKVGNKLVVYAEKNKIIRSLQALREKLGLPQGGARKTRRGQRSTNLGARDQNETSQEDRFPASQAPFLKQLLRNGVEFSLHQSDITDEQVDAIVNAANEWLQHGGGVAAAIVRKGGRQIEDESRGIMSQRHRRPLNVGDAVYTRGGNLPCHFVIHTVGPRWNDHDRKKSISLLHQACLESLRLAAQLELCSIALPAISSGIFGMPKTICATVMFDAVEEFSSSTDAEFSTLRDVRIVIIDDETISFFREEFVKRYTSQETSPTKPTHQERPSTEGQKGSSASNATVEPPSFSSDNELLEEQSKKSGENDEVETPNESVGPDNESGDHHKEVLDRIKEVHPSNKNIPSTNKASPPTSIETPDVETEANGTNEEAGLKASASVKSSELLNMNTAARPAFGRGRGVLAANLSGRPHRKPGSKSNGGTQLQEKDKTENANAGRGRGMTHAAGSFSPPGLTVTGEGILLARKLGKQVNDDLNIDPGESMNENKEEEKKESIEEASKEENQEPKHNNQNIGEDRLNDECPQGHSKDENNSNHSQWDRDAASGTRLSPDGGITESQDTEKESPQISATDNNSKLPNNKNKPNQGENETKASKQELDQASSDATDNKTTHLKRPLPSNQLETSYVTKEVTPTASYESVNDPDTMEERQTGENSIARPDGGKRTFFLSFYSKIRKYILLLLKHLTLIGQVVNVLSVAGLPVA